MSAITETEPGGESDVRTPESILARLGERGALSVKLSPRQVEVLGLFQVAKAVVPGRSRLLRTVEALERRGLVDRVQDGDGGGMTHFKLSAAGAVTPRAEPKLAPKKAGRVVPLSIAVTTPTVEISVGDVVLIKQLNVEGCVRDRLADGSFWVCARFNGSVYPFQLEWDDLRRVGAGTKPCRCEEP